jgi:hypothetical protein
MALQTQFRYSFEDYLAAEREAEIRHEYVDGQVFDMVGATENHNIIVANLTPLLVNQMKGRPCLVYATDMKVRIDVADACKYPDVTALCGERKFLAMSALGVGALTMPAFTEGCCLSDLLYKQHVTDGPTLNADIAFC